MMAPFPKKQESPTIQFPPSPPTRDIIVISYNQVMPQDRTCPENIVITNGNKNIYINTGLNDVIFTKNKVVMNNRFWANKINQRVAFIFCFIE